MREESDVDRCRGMRGWCALGALQKCACDFIGEIADTISKKLVPGLGELAFVNEWGRLGSCPISGSGRPSQKHSFRMHW
jgi:hypothetical protein